MGQELDGCDDPYKMLAYFVVSHYSLPQIQRILTEDAYVKKQVVNDCLDLDVHGPFLDAMMYSIEQSKRLWLRGVLRTLGEQMFTQLDLERLRDNIQEIIALPL